jgi:integrase
MKKQINVRGVFEKVKGSGDWWIRYADANGKIRREKGGTRSAAITLYGKRKAEAWQGVKLPAKLRARKVRFVELADDYLAANNNLGRDVDKYRIAALREAFKDKPAEVPVSDIREWFGKQDWEPGTYNRCRTVLGLVFKLGMENKKIENNPARLLKRLREPSGRVRFLNQYAPDEEHRLRKVIVAEYPQHLPEFEIALNTGLRRKEQYTYIGWGDVDFLRRDLFVPESKTGMSRHIDLNEDAVNALKELFSRTGGKGPIFVAEKHKLKETAAGLQREDVPLRGPRHWFEKAIAEAEIDNFTWHDLRHTFASRLAMAGVDLRTVAELMGHAKIQMTMRYAHLAKRHTRTAVEKLSAFNALERARQGTESPAILVDAELENATDTKTDTGENGAPLVTSVNVQ